MQQDEDDRVIEICRSDLNVSMYILGFLNNNNNNSNNICMCWCVSLNKLARCNDKNDETLNLHKLSTRQPAMLVTSFSNTGIIFGVKKVQTYKVIIKYIKSNVIILH